MEAPAEKRRHEEHRTPVWRSVSTQRGFAPNLLSQHPISVVNRESRCSASMHCEIHPVEFEEEAKTQEEEEEEEDEQEEEKMEEDEEESRRRRGCSGAIEREKTLCCTR